ncbi:MAG: hypothetical protein ACMUIE_08230 [Thermoplasmatota archaeon]
MMSNSISTTQKGTDFELKVRGIYFQLGALKVEHNKNIDGTKELEVEVDDFDKTNLILEKLGYIHKGYQENKRTMSICLL